MNAERQSNVIQQTEHNDSSLASFVDGASRVLDLGCVMEARAGSFVSDDEALAMYWETVKRDFEEALKGLQNA